MSVITSINKNSKPTEREASEFDGLWINVGVAMAGEPDPETGKPTETFVRLPRGVAISDLKPRKVYDNMDPTFAAQVNLANQLIDLIQTKAAALAEGESVAVNLECQLYRRQEESAVAPTPQANTDLANALFG